MRYRKTARIGNGADGAIHVVAVRDVFGNSRNRAPNGQDGAFAAVAPPGLARTVAHSRPSALPVGDGKSVVTRLVIEVADGRIAVRVALARHTVLGIVGECGSNSARVSAAAERLRVTRAEGAARCCVVITQRSALRAAHAGQTRKAVV